MLPEQRGAQVQLKRADELEPGDRFKARNRAHGGPVIVSIRQLRNGMFEIQWGFNGRFIVRPYRTFEVLPRV